MVDTRHTEIRMAVHDLVYGYLYTVSRCARAVIGGYIHIIKYMGFGQPQWLIDSDGMSHAGLRGVRGYDDHFTKGPYGFDQCPDTGSGDTIIIYYQDKGF